MSRRLADPGKKEKDETEQYFRLVRSGLKGFIPFHELEEVRCVPTLFTSYNRATGRGGQPVGKMVVVHGQEQKGKSAFVLGILESLGQAGFPGEYEDAEMAAEKRWYSHICKSRSIEDKPVCDLDTVNEDLIRILNNIEAAQAAKKMPRSIGAAFAIDTLTVLMPRKIIELIEKEGIEKMYPIQALHVSTMIKMVVPKLWKTNSVLIVVLQEREKLDKKGPFDKDYKLTLGKAVQYGNAVRVRITGSERIKHGKQIVGTEVFFTVENNKVDGTTFQAGSFFTSNGSISPLGLDLISEAMTEAKRREWLYRQKIKETERWVLEMRTTDLETGEENVGRKVALAVDWPKSWAILDKEQELFRELVSALNASSCRVVITDDGVER